MKIKDTTTSFLRHCWKRKALLRAEKTLMKFMYKVAVVVVVAASHRSFNMAAKRKLGSSINFDIESIENHSIDFPLVVHSAVHSYE